MTVYDERRRQLPVTPLRDVVDVEALARGALLQAHRRWPVPLEPCDFDDTLAFLLAQAFTVLDGKYPAARARKPWLVFRPWLFQELVTDTIDYWRSQRGRRGQHVHESLEKGHDADGLDDAWLIDPADPVDDQLADRLADAREQSADGVEDRLADLDWLQATRDRGLAREDGKLGLRTRVRAEARASSIAASRVAALTEDREELAA